MASSEGSGQNRWRSAILSQLAQQYLHAQAQVFQEPNGAWTLELHEDRSHIGDSYEAARDALKLLINELGLQQ